MMSAGAANIIFLSTLPARGATWVGERCIRGETVFLSTLPARGATAGPSGWPQQYLHKFLSTLPARGATEYKAANDGTTDISIHAPREGSDHHTDSPEATQ